MRGAFLRVAEITPDDDDGTNADLLYEWCKKRAEERVESNWPHIVVVAEALVQREEIQGDEIPEIIRAKVE